MGLNHLMICTYSADDLRPLMTVRLAPDETEFLAFSRARDMLCFRLPWDSMALVLQREVEKCYISLYNFRFFLLSSVQVYSPMQINRRKRKSPPRIRNGSLSYSQNGNDRYVITNPPFSLWTAAMYLYDRLSHHLCRFARPTENLNSHTWRFRRSQANVFQ